MVTMETLPKRERVLANHFLPWNRVSPQREQESLRDDCKRNKTRFFFQKLFDLRLGTV